MIVRQLTNIWYIALKELKLFLSNRGAVIFGLLFPFFFVTLFYFLMQGVGGEDRRLKLYITTREPRGGISHEIISQLETRDASSLQPGQPEIVYIREYQEARSRVERKDIGGFISFPADFSKHFVAGQNTTIEVVAHTDRPYERAALNGLAHSIASELGTRQLAARTVISMLSDQGRPTDIPTAVQQIVAGSRILNTGPVQTVTEEAGLVEAKNPANFVIPGYLVMFVFFTAALSAERLVRERQNHTLERLLASSVSKEALLGGIFTGTVFKGLVQIVIFWASGLFIFGLDLGPQPLTVILLSLVMVFMSAAFSLMLATLVRTERASSSIGVLASLVLAPLGGCWWPLFITPHWMQNLALMTPHGWAVTGFNKLMLYGGGFRDVVPSLLMLTGFGTIFAILAITRFRTSAV